jgi:hypothetical protein
MNTTYKKFLPHLIAYAVFMALAFMRFAPVVFEGKLLQQYDNIQSRGMQVEMREIEAQTGEFPLWTNSMFAGMPTYQILYPAKGFTKDLLKVLLLGNSVVEPHTAILLMMVGFYLLMMVMGVDWRVGIVGGLGLGLAAYHIGLQEAGHSTKLLAASFSAPAIAGLVLTFRGRYLLGGSLTALALSLHFFSNHIQVTYLLFMTLIVFGLAYLVDAIRNGTLPAFAKAAAVSLLAVGLGMACNTGRLLTTQEYAEETIRGKSELKEKANSSSSNSGEGGGLSKEYAFQWSYGKLETFNLLIPNFLGGSSSEGFVSDPNSATLAALRQMNNPEEANQLAQMTTHYWGDMPFTGGPIYMGAIFLFLFFMGVFLIEKPFKWYLIGGLALAILLSWGRNFSAFNYFIFDHFPFFNKFRDATTVLGVGNLLVVIGATLGLQAFLDKDTQEQQRKKALILGGGITGGLLLLAVLISFTFDFAKPGAELPPAVAAALAEDRAALLYSDAFRSLVFAGLAFGALWLWMKKRFAAAWPVLLVGTLAVVDVWGVGSRLLGEDDFMSASERQQIIAPTAADEQIKQDPDPYYRVADFRRSPFTNALTSYHHLSLGGYHAAKLVRFQEMVERYLGDPQANRHIYNMFNAKYFITQDDKVIPNPEALGNAWFVREYEIVPDGDAEMAALADLKPAEKVVVQEKFAGELKGFQLQYDSTASIQLTSYAPEELVYSYTAATDQVAVFSDMYYPPAKGWEMYIDGQRAPDFFKANYTLRGARLPAGKHELKMVFDPKTYKNGELISTISSAVVILLAAFAIFWFHRKNGWRDPANLPGAADKTASRPIARKTEPGSKRK